jgi:hypothetical protein
MLVDYWLQEYQDRIRLIGRNSTPFIEVSANEMLVVKKEGKARRLPIRADGYFPLPVVTFARNSNSLFELLVYYSYPIVIDEGGRDPPFFREKYATVAWERDYD